MTKNIFWLLLFYTNFLFSQESEHYIYASIPSQFSFQKEKNQYRINSTLKAFFQQQGYTTFLDDEILSESFSNSNCNKIYVDIEVKNSIFSTNLFVITKDCNNAILQKSSEGSSRQKDLKIAYNEALLKALKSLKNINYKSKNSGKKTSIVQTEKVENISKTDDSNSTTYFSKNTNSFVTLKKTGRPNLFIANSEQNNGLVTVINNKYIFEYYLDGLLVTEELEVRK